jgi:hypothetical protein
LFWRKRDISVPVLLAKGYRSILYARKKEKQRKKGKRGPVSVTERKQNKEKWEQRSTASRLADKVPYTSEKEGHQPL